MICSAAVDREPLTPAASPSRPLGRRSSSTAKQPETSAQSRLCMRLLEEADSAEARPSCDTSRGILAHDGAPVAHNFVTFVWVCNSLLPCVDLTADGVSINPSTHRLRRCRVGLHCPISHNWCTPGGRRSPVRSLCRCRCLVPESRSAGGSCCSWRRAPTADRSHRSQCVRRR